MQRQTYTEGSPWEPIVGYARAVKIGNIIEISGTTATVNGEVVGKGDVYEQTKCILQKFEKDIYKKWENSGYFNQLRRSRSRC